MTDFSLPIGGSYTVGRTDRGVDFETSPGTPVLAVVSGVISAINGFFPQVVIKPDSGSVRGYPGVYYGHLSGGDILVHRGQHVTVGQQIARTSQRPPLAEDMPGHIEVGLSTSLGGSIEAAHDDSHNTKSGNTIAAIFHALGLPGVGKKGKGAAGSLSGAGGVAGQAAGDAGFPTPDEIAKTLVQGIAAALGENGLKILLSIGLVVGGVIVAGLGTARLSGARVQPEDVAKLATATKGKG